MKTFTTLKNLATNLSNNTSTDNDALMGQLIDDQHRYLIQKYFDNERSVTFQTIGSQSLTLTGSLIAGATSATLTAAWTYSTYYQLVTFSDGEQRNALFTNGSTAITWANGLTGAATTAVTALGVQFYNIPANVSKIKDNTIQIGQLKFRPKFLQTRQEWDDINMLPYSSDIPQYAYIYGNQLGIYPIPSTTGNVIQFNYKTRVSSFSYADYSTGNLATGGAAPGSASITGTGTAWNTVYPTGQDLSFSNLAMKINTPYGDGIWYPVLSFSSATGATLGLPIINAPQINASTTYTIGQLPLLSEDFHDMLVYGALKTYFSSIAPDLHKFKQFEALYSERLQMLEEYAGTKNLEVDLGVQPAMVNPNLFIYSTN